MHAIIYDRFGSADVFRRATIDPPTLPDDGVLVAVKASTVNVIDIRTRDGKMSPLVNKTFPKIPGVDIAGIVTAVGAKATRFKVGDAVFGAKEPLKGGAFADIVALPENALALLPRTAGFDEAACLPVAGLAALYSLRELGKAKPGDRVLIYGASGATGLFAVQLAKHFGLHVTAVAGTQGVEAARQMGADVTIDYRRDTVTFDAKFSLIIDYAGAFPFAKARHSLTPNGRFIESSPTVRAFIGSMLANPFRRQKHLMLVTQAKTKDLEFLAGLVDAGTLKATIAATYPMARTADAFSAMEKGGVIGKIVVKIGS